MEYIEYDEIESYRDVHDLVIKHNEAFQVEDENGKTVISLPDGIYTSLLARIAELDHDLRDDVLITVGDHAADWTDTSIHLPDVASSLGITLELLLEVCYRINQQDEIFREIDSETCLISIVGWEKYEWAKKVQLEYELSEMEKPTLLLDECGDPVYADQMGIHRCTTLDDEEMDYDALHDKLINSEKIKSELIARWDSMSFEELKHYHGEFDA